MRIDRKKELIIIIVLYLIALYIWTLPLQKSNMPYGEVDAVSHFTVGDYIAHSNEPMSKLPHYLDVRYGRDNSFRPGTLWYAPPYHMNLAIMQIAGGERFVPIFLFVAIISSVIVFITYFFMREMFGFIPALLSSSLVAFSARDYMVMLWGQWPERISHFYLPIILYAAYKYIDSYLDGKPRPVYAYLTAIFLGISLYLHPMGFFHAVVVIGVFCLFIYLKERRQFFEWKTAGIAAILFLVMLAVFPYNTGRVVYDFIGKGDSGPGAAVDVSRLLYWYKTPENPPVDPAYFSYGRMLGLWTLPFLLIGIGYLLMRRGRKELVMLAWLVGMYIVLHLDMIGLNPFAHRSLAATMHIFAPLIALGVMAVGTFFKDKNARYVIALAFLVIVLISPARNAYTYMSNAYPPISRVSAEQLELADWLNENVDEEANSIQVGGLSMAKTRWIWMLAYRYIEYGKPLERYNYSYMIFDYSDWIKLGNQQALAFIQAREKELNSTPGYATNTIRVYQIEDI